MSLHKFIWSLPRKVIMKSDFAALYGATYARFIGKE